MSSQDLPKVQVGVIGGSGLYDLDELKEVRSVPVETPYGPPSGEFLCGKLEGVSVAFLPRHGVGHTIPPSRINFRANIYALKSLGVESIISVSAVGSMKEEIAPGDLIIPDQFVDRTQGRKSTFFEEGVVAHIAFAEPTCPQMSEIVYHEASKLEKKVHRGGVYLCIEGPQFSTRAESRIYRSWGVDVIGMTNLPEARLAREAEICYTPLALSTDYDCWKGDEASVTTEKILQTLLSNVAAAKEVIRAALPQVSQIERCLCREALKDAVVTDLEKVSDAVRKRFHWLLGNRCKTGSKYR